MCHNKYYGRSLSIAGFQHALYQFLHNGTRLRVDVLPPLIQKLEELDLILSQQEAFRFYTSSLLLLYEGSDPASTDLCASVKCESAGESDVIHLNHKPVVIDRKKLGRSVSADTVVYLRPLEGNNSSSFKKLAKKKKHQERSRSLDPDLNFNNYSNDSGLLSVTDDPLVDVRIIDFAHSTHKGLGDSVMYSGPDRGFLFGLENLIGLLKGIEREYR